MVKTKLALNVYLGTLKESWIKYCKESNQKPGVLLKKLAQQQLKENTNTQPLQQTKEHPDDAKKQRFTILLTPSEKAALEIMAERENCSQRRWVIDAIRVGLTKEPQFSMKEIQVLGDSNYQLLRIGCNLNQIAKAMNQGAQPSQSSVDELVKELRQVINAHTKKVSDAIGASLRRWDIE